MARAPCIAAVTERQMWDDLAGFEESAGCGPARPPCGQRRRETGMRKKASFIERAPPPGEREDVRRRGAGTRCPPSRRATVRKRVLAVSVADPGVLGDDSSKSQCTTILPWIGTSGKYATLAVNANGLAAAMRRGDQAEPVASLEQAFDCLRRKISLYLYLLAERKYSRHIQRFLNVQPEVQNIRDNMTMPEGLVITTHDAERHLDSFATSHHAGHEGVHWFLTRTDAVWVSMIQIEGHTAVLEHHTGSRAQDATAKRIEDGINEADCVQVPVDNTYIDGVGL